MDTEKIMEIVNMGDPKKFETAMKDMVEESMDMNPMELFERHALYVLGLLDEKGKLIFASLVNIIDLQGKMLEKLGIQPEEVYKDAKCDCPLCQKLRGATY